MRGILVSIESSRNVKGRFPREVHTETHAGPDTRTTAIAALPGAVDKAYIVESASSINRVGLDEEKLRMLPGVLRGRGVVRIGT